MQKEYADGWCHRQLYPIGASSSSVSGGKGYVSYKRSTVEDTATSGSFSGFATIRGACCFLMVRAMGRREIWPALCTERNGGGARKGTNAVILKQVPSTMLKYEAFLRETLDRLFKLQQRRNKSCEDLGCLTTEAINSEDGAPPRSDLKKQIAGSLYPGKMYENTTSIAVEKTVRI